MASCNTTPPQTAAGNDALQRIVAEEIQRNRNLLRGDQGATGKAGRAGRSATDTIGCSQSMMQSMFIMQWERELENLQQWFLEPHQLCDELCDGILRCINPYHSDYHSESQYWQIDPFPKSNIVSESSPFKAAATNSDDESEEMMPASFDDEDDDSEFGDKPLHLVRTCIVVSAALEPNATSAEAVSAWQEMQSIEPTMNFSLLWQAIDVQFGFHWRRRRCTASAAATTAAAALEHERPPTPVIFASEVATDLSKHSSAQQRNGPQPRVFEGCTMDRALSHLYSNVVDKQHVELARVAFYVDQQHTLLACRMCIAIHLFSFFKMLRHVDNRGNITLLERSAAPVACCAFMTPRQRRALVNRALEQTDHDAILY